MLPYDIVRMMPRVNETYTEVILFNKYYDVIETLKTVDTQFLEKAYEYFKYTSLHNDRILI